VNKLDLFIILTQRTGSYRSLDAITDAIHSTTDVFEGNCCSMAIKDVALVSVTQLANLAPRKVV
jgi:hypothetical protein